MTNKERLLILESIRTKNDFFPIDEENCREKNASMIENMEKIFDLKSSMDYTCLLALIELWADDDIVEDIKEFLLQENSYSMNKVRQPDWNTKLLVTTALVDNPLFFSMAWNWSQIIESKVQENRKKLDAESDDPWFMRIAASTGNTQFGEKPLDGLGTIFIDCREKYKEFYVGIKLNDSVLGKEFIVTQRIKMKDTDKEFEAHIKTNGRQILYSEPFYIDEYGNPANGFKYIGSPKISEGISTHD